MNHPGASFTPKRDMLRRRFSLPRALITLALIFAIPTLLACASSNEDSDVERPSDGLELVWEAWERVSEIYASSGSLDAERVVSGSMGRVLQLVDVSPYPFLTDIGRMRGQPPSNVPGELVDLWRAVAMYSAEHPDFDPEAVAEAAVAGMLDGLGDTSAVYLDPDQYPLAKENLESSVEGSYLGIGARVVSQDDLILLFPFSSSPAEKAGIEPGDALVAVGGQSVAGETVQEIVDKVAGPEGTKVTLQIRRVGLDAPLDLDVFRGTIELPSVASQLIPGGIGYVRITRFRGNTGEQVFSALESLNQFDMLALILDLRTNPGGSSEAAQETAGQFLSDGSVFGSREDRDGERTDQLIAANDQRLDLEDLLIAVLVNEQTARDAEALAGALQDSGKAVLFGVPTFGDASAYEFVELSNGGAMYLPVSRWYIPSGELLGKSGLMPDFEVESVPENEGYGGESQFNRAYEYLDEKLPAFR
tara:strand:+ start:2920 stop:4347 length:1428 start_codon:yes stop_codon:yes gene_type:complete